MSIDINDNSQALDLTKNSLKAFIGTLEDMDKVTSILNINTILSVSNFEKLKTNIVTNNLLDKLNSLLIKYSTLRLKQDILSEMFSNMFFKTEGMVEAEIIEYEELSNPDKLLFELVVIFNI